jgi:hypothetical protein
MRPLKPARTLPDLPVTAPSDAAAPSKAASPTATSPTLAHYPSP